MKHPKIQIAPSILAANFGALAEEVKRAEGAGADLLHIDVMDGHFVPNLTLGPQIVAAINRTTDLPLDVHLMIYNPFAYIERFVEAGADSITFHLEATEDVEDTLKFIRTCGIRGGLAFNPETSFAMIPRYLDLCDIILLMTVNPGFGGQPLIPEVLEKVKLTRESTKYRDTSLPYLDIQVDGGIDLSNIADCVEAGANVIVAGTSLFHAPDMEQVIRKMREAVRPFETR